MYSIISFKIHISVLDLIYKRVSHVKSDKSVVDVLGIFSKCFNLHQQHKIFSRYFTT